MKAVLISIQPQYCKTIANGVKTLEIRKNHPKLKPPFTCYIYCTQHTGPNDLLELHNESGKIHKINGKVVAEFTCDRIEKIMPYHEYYADGYNIDDDTLTATCLTQENLMEYGKGKPLYAWHISNLEVYDEPKALNVLSVHDNTYDNAFDWAFDDREKTYPLTRPPQSWCYVTEI